MRKEVWNNAIKCFKEKRNPFDTDELCKMNVTLDECGDLSEGIANAMDFQSFVVRNFLEIFAVMVIAEEYEPIDDKKRKLVYEMLNQVRLCKIKNKK